MRAARRYACLSALFVFLHVALMLCRYGDRPTAPVLGDEVITNDPALSIARGHGLTAMSFASGKYGLDRLYAHYPPGYPYVASLAFRAFGVSVYSLRFTTTVCSIVSTIVFAFGIFLLCRASCLHWDVGLLLNAIVCTQPTLMSLERIARVESMIGLLLMVALAAIVYAVTRPPGPRTWPALLVAGIAAGAGMGVHPEALMAVLLAGALLLGVAPVGRMGRILSVCAITLAPAVIGLAAYRTQMFAAIEQFLHIARDAKVVNPSSGERFHQILHSSNLQDVSRSILLVTILAMMIASPAVYLWLRSRSSTAPMRLRLAASLAAAAIVQLGLEVLLFDLDDRRVQYLFGPLLAMLAICLLGAAPMRRWVRIAGYTLVVLQLAGASLYLLSSRAPGVNTAPDRFASLVRSLPPKATVAATPELWLDLAQENRPFTLIYYGLGESGWDRSNGNPFDRYDIILLQQSEVEAHSWFIEDARAGRTRSYYRIAGETVTVYARPQFKMEVTNQ